MGRRTNFVTAVFQRALDSVHKAGGGIGYAPPGRTSFVGPQCAGGCLAPRFLSLRADAHGCTGQGANEAWRGWHSPLRDEWAGEEDGKPFLTLNSNSSVNGFCIFYPEQDAGSIPAAYRWTIAMCGKNPAVQMLSCSTHILVSTRGRMSATTFAT